MKRHNLFYNLKAALCAAAVAVVAVPAISSADVVVISGTTDNQAIADYLLANYSNVTAAEIRQGDFSDFNAAATQTALTGANFVIIGRTLASGAYAGATASPAQGYNNLAIPVVNFTSFTARDLGNRMGWHTGSTLQNVASTLGAETNLTAAGEAFFGTTGAKDWHNSGGDNLNSAASVGANFGGGQVLATISDGAGGDGALVAIWDAQAAPGNPTAAGTAAFAGKRLLFNLDNDAANGFAQNFTFASLQPGGYSALQTSMVWAGFSVNAIPEPSSMVVLSLVGLAGLARRRR